MTEELREKLIALLDIREDLFERVDDDWDEFDPEDSEAFFADGEASILEVDGITYRFILDEVAQFVGDEVYKI